MILKTYDKYNPPSPTRYKRKIQAPQPPIPEFLQKRHKEILTAEEILLIDRLTKKVIARQLRADVQNQLHLRRSTAKHIGTLDLSKNAYKVLMYLISRINDLNYSTVYPISTPDDLGISWMTIEHSLKELKDNDLIRPTDYVNVYEMNPEIFQQIQT